MINVMVLQRESHVALGVPSLSVDARVTEVLDYLHVVNKVEYIVIPENIDVAGNALKWADFLILSKHNSNVAYELLIKAKKIGVKVIYDVDDWVFSFPSYSGAIKVSSKREQMLQMIAQADYVTVANNNIQLEILKYCKEALIIPNGMYVEKYSHSICHEHIDEVSPPRIVFTNADLLKLSYSKDIFIDVLHNFFQDNRNYVIDFYGDPFPEMFSMPFLHFSNRMNYQDYMISLRNGKYQFSITPLGGAEDAENWFFNSCKNPFKYLNYGAACVPGVYSNSPIYEDCVTNYNTGILVENTKDEWLNALNTMAQDSSLRKKIRERAYEDVIENHHIKYSADKLFSIFA